MDEIVERKPVEELTAFVAGASWLFYRAEAGHNPGVRSYWDAFHYIATSLSVGYANIFPVTPLGKIVGSLVMMLGPALSARALEPPHHEAGVVEKLDEVLVELRKLNARSEA